MSITVEKLVAEIEANPAAAIAALEAFDRASADAAKDRTAHIKVDTDTSGAAMAAAVMNSISSSSGGARASLEGLSITSHTTSTALRQLGFVISGLQLGGIYALATSAAGGLQMLAAAAAGAAGAIAPLIGLLGALPVGIGAVVGGLAATVMGLSGVSKGYQAMSTVMGASTGGMAAAARTNWDLIDANRALKEAIRGVADAQRNLAEANRRVDEAREQAAKNLKNYARDVRDAVWSEEDAVERLRRAQENLARAQRGVGKSGAILSKETDEFTGKVYEVARISADAVDAADSRAEAERAVLRAQQDLERAQERTADSRERLNEAEKKGVEGSDLVQSALRNQAEAARMLVRRQEDVVRAQERIARVMDEAKRRAAGGAAGINALNKAMANLSPAGQSFVKFLHNEFMPAVKKIKFAAQEGLLPGVEQGLRNIMTLFPYFEEQAFKWAKAVGDAFKGWTEHLISKDVQVKFKETVDGLFAVLAGGIDKNGKETKGLLDAFIPLTDIFLSITRAATPMTRLLTDRLVSGLERLADRMDTVAGNEKMVKFFDDAAYFSGLWWKALKPLATIIWDVVEAARPLAEWMLKGMASSLEDMAKWTSSIEGQTAMTDWLNSMKPAISETMGLLGDLFKMIFTTENGGEDSAFVKTVKEIRKSLLPALERLFETLDKSDFGPKFVLFVTAIVDGLNALSEHDGVFSLIMDGIKGIADIFRGLSDITGGMSTDAIIGLLTAIGAFKLGKGIGKLVNRSFIQPIKDMIGVAKGAPGKMSNLGTKIAKAMDLGKAAASTVAHTGAMAARWAWFALTTTASAIKAGAAWTISTIAGGAKAVASMVVNTAKILAQWVIMAAQSLVHAGRMAAAWVIGVIAPAARAVAAMIVQSGIMIAKWVLMGTQALLQAGRMALAWVIAMGPIGWAIAAVIGLGIIIWKNWDKIVAWTKDKWGTVSKWISDVWATLTKKAGEFKDWVVTKWNELIGFFSGIKPKINEKLGGVWDGLKTGFKSVLNTIIRWWNDLSFTMPQVDLGIFGKHGGFRLDFPNVPEFKQFGGKVEGGQSYIVGEKRAEVLTLPEGMNGRIASAVPRPVSSGGGGGGMTDEQLERVLEKVLAKAKPNFDIEQNFYEKADPKAIGSDLAWRFAQA